MHKIPSKREYKIGDVLIFKGDSIKFVVGKKYKIIKKHTIDYNIDELDTSYYGNEALYFENTDFGCYDTFADENFEPINEHRDKILNRILND
jgi:hypothetical protein